MKSRLTGSEATGTGASREAVHRAGSTAAPLTGGDGHRAAAAGDRALAPWLEAIGPSPILLTPQNTSVAFRVRWLGGLIVRGMFRDVRGAVQVPRDDPSAASVSIEIAAGSVRTGISLRDRHLRGPLFLDVARHPTISFRGGNAMRWPTHLTMPGSLTVRGIVHTQELHCSAESGMPGNGETTIRLVASTVLDRRAYSVGTPRGLRRLDPLFVVIGGDVNVEISMVLPVRT